MDYSKRNRSPLMAKMTKEQIEILKQKLLDERNEIFSNLKADEEILNKNSDYVEDSGELAFDNLDKDIIAKISSHEKETLRQMDKALKRIDAGDFGVCTECGADIGFERLEVLPYVQICKDCATKKK